MKELFQEFQKTKQELSDQIQALDEEQINTVPFPGSWTPGQLTEHILKSDQGLGEFLRAADGLTERDPAEKVSEIRDLLLNFDIKLTAPDFIVPGNGPYRKEDLLDQMKSNTAYTLEATRNMDLETLNEDFELPVFGKLTRLEWLYFNMYHTQRHLFQLKNMVRLLSY